jgi:hypothetical protein
MRSGTDTNGGTLLMRGYPSGLLEPPFLGLGYSFRWKATRKGMPDSKHELSIVRPQTVLHIHCSVERFSFV